MQILLVLKREAQRLGKQLAFIHHSPAVREVLADLVLGRQGYEGLKRRLLRAGPRFVWDMARSRAA